MTVSYEQPSVLFVAGNPETHLKNVLPVIAAVT